LRSRRPAAPQPLFAPLPLHRRLQQIAAPPLQPTEENMSAYPDTLRYTKEHEWAKLDGKIARVGITVFAKDQLGDVVFLELPAVGTAVTKGAQFGVVESTKAVSELYAPLTGKVVAMNQALVDEPAGVNDDPHGKGWMIDIEFSDPAELADLLDAAAYAKLVA
jgi:glycine cleavage system H protein